MSSQTESPNRDRKRGRSPVLVRLCDVPPSEVEWLWPGRIALGKFTLITGDPGLGKSFLTMDLAARVSRGLPWPDNPAANAPLGDVVLLSAEDGLADTVRPRLDAAGADPSRVIALEAIQDKNGRELACIDLGRDLPAITGAIEQHPECRLLIVDPISAYLGGVDSHRNSEVRGLLAPLAALAKQKQIAVLAVTHLRKGEGSAIHRSIGSIGFVGAARAAWLLAKDPEDEGRRLLLPIKNNLARDVLGMAFHITEAGTTAVVEWESEPVEISADDVLASQSGPPTPSALDRAVDWLASVLADGPIAGERIKERASAEGITPRTLERAVRKLRVKCGPDGFGGPWVWRLPGPAPDNPDSAQSANLEPLANTGDSGALCGVAPAPVG